MSENSNSINNAISNAVNNTVNNTVNNKFVPLSSCPVSLITHLPVTYCNILPDECYMSEKDIVAEIYEAIRDQLSSDFVYPDVDKNVYTNNGKTLLYRQPPVNKDIRQHYVDGEKYLIFPEYYYQRYNPTIYTQMFWEMPLWAIDKADTVSNYKVTNPYMCKIVAGFDWRELARNHIKHYLADKLAKEVITMAENNLDELSKLVNGGLALGQKDNSRYFLEEGRIKLFTQRLIDSMDVNPDITVMNLELADIKETSYLADKIDTDLIPDGTALSLYKATVGINVSISMDSIPDCTADFFNPTEFCHYYRLYQEFLSGGYEEKYVEDVGLPLEKVNENKYIVLAKIGFMRRMKEYEDKKRRKDEGESGSEDENESDTQKQLESATQEQPGISVQKHSEPTVQKLPRIPVQKQPECTTQKPSGTMDWTVESQEESQKESQKESKKEDEEKDPIDTQLKDIFNNMDAITKSLESISACLAELKEKEEYIIHCCN